MKRPAFAGAGYALLITGLSICASIAGCADESGVSTGVLYVDALSDPDGVRAADLPANTCSRVPVLRGGQRDLRYPISGALFIELSTTRDWVRVSFTGAAGAPQRLVFGREEWMQGTELSVESLSGERFRVLLSGVCPQP